MSKDKVVILGLNGHIGQAAAAAFVAAGWDVTGMARTEKLPVPGVRFVAGDASSVEDMRRAIGDAPVVVNALNLPYGDWYEGRKEALMDRVLQALGTTGRTVLLPGNIYNYSASDRYVTPDLPQHPQTPRGAIRVRVEQQLRAAAERGDVQAIILRAGDFYGPDAGRDWFDLGIFTDLKKGVIHSLGVPGVPRAWAYLPDLGRAFEALASMRRSLGADENFHFAGDFVTPEQMTAAILAVAPGPLKVTPLPLWLLRMIGLFDPTMREISKMDYLWRKPMELVDPRLAGILGEDFFTPFPEAMATTVAPFFAAGHKGESERHVNARLSAA